MCAARNWTNDENSCSPSYAIGLRLSPLGNSFSTGTCRSGTYSLSSSLSSTFILATTKSAELASTLASCCSSGAIRLHGPHQSALTARKTLGFESSTSSSNESATTIVSPVCTPSPSPFGRTADLGLVAEQLTHLTASTPLRQPHSLHCHTPCGTWRLRTSSASSRWASSEMNRELPPCAQLVDVCCAEPHSPIPIQAVTIWAMNIWAITI